MLEQKEFICIMIDIYGDLLTKKQLSTIEQYYKLDYSLNEIALEYDVTKQAIKDTIDKAVKSLNKFEEVLGLANREVELRKINLNELSKEELIQIIKR